MTEILKRFSAIVYWSTQSYFFFIEINSLQWVLSAPGFFIRYAHYLVGCQDSNPCWPLSFAPCRLLPSATTYCSVQYWRNLLQLHNYSTDWIETAVITEKGKGELDSRVDRYFTKKWVYIGSCGQAMLFKVIQKVFLLLFVSFTAPAFFFFTLLTFYDFL